ncbi:MAG: HAD family hydrolase [Acetobacteraceae bacterium]|nr:HAD family hydrolase [Acetobacteraceae bacterium]
MLFDLGGTLGFDLPPWLAVPERLWPPGAGPEAVAKALLRAAERYYRLYHFRQLEAPPRLRLEREWFLALSELGAAGGLGQAWREARQLARGGSSPAPFQRYPEVEPVLAGLRLRGLRLGLVSNARRQAPAVLAMANLHHHFHAVVVSDLVGLSKPDPRIFRLALAACGAGRREVLFVGNDPECDAAGAEAAGLKAVLVDRHHKLDRRRCAWPVVSDLWGVVALVDGRAAAAEGGGRW